MSMLCEKCQQREAAVELTEVRGEQMTLSHVCTECASAAEDAASVSLEELMAPAMAPERYEALAARDGRFPVQAYQFVSAGILTAKQNKSAPGELGMFEAIGITADDLLAAWKQLALEWFGGNAKMTLRNWGITRTEDFGEIIFRMVDAGLIGQNAQDSRVDFANGYDFDVVFPET
jgi:uncharacterized repeat protein (TIGR04138 family)